jgi:transpeptidase family protein/penicillin-binding protein/MecA-like transpeptidase family protein
LGPSGRPGGASKLPTAPGGARGGGRGPRRSVRPVIAMALTAFAVGAVVGANHSSSAARDTAVSFVRAWADGDYRAMYRLIYPGSPGTLSERQMAGECERALRTSTATRVRLMGHVHSEPEGTFEVPVQVDTRLFATLSLSFAIRVVEGTQGPRVRWARSLTFPGLRTGESLSRDMQLPARAALLARDGSLLAGGPALAAGQRSSPLGAAAEAVVGQVGPVPASRRSELEAQGVPANAIVGVSGLERTFDDRLRGSPGGELLAGTRVLARTQAHRGISVRTSISPTVQRAAALALGGQYGGVVALDPRSGDILGVAGIALEGLQPPGSTFKMVTVSGVLEAGIASPTSVFPYATSTLLDGVKLENANGESCGGSLALAFAVSCNSVFAPLGAKLGAARLVSTAERFGFNHETGLPGASESTLPHASEIQGELDVGSTAIGQGQVQASPLQMALVAATIADGGRRPSLSFEDRARATFTPAIGAAVAHTVRRLMIGVVREGTGTAAAIPGVTVAGKTGTAELGNAHCGGESSTAETSSSSSSETCSGKSPQNTDAWFAAFAPALTPRVVVGVLMVKDGAGGETAAPVAREVLEAALR